MDYKGVIASLSWYEAFSVCARFLQDPQVLHPTFLIEELEILIDAAQVRIDEIKKAEHERSIATRA